MRTSLLLLWVVACGKSDNKQSEQVDEPPKVVATDPACAAKAKELETWLAQLETETASHETNFGWTPVVLDRAPAKVTQEADYVMLTPKQVSAWDHSEANHVGDNIGAGKDPEERLAKVFEMKGAPAGDDVIRIDIDAEAPWSDVARLVETAAQLGYTKAVFAFEGTSKLAVPAGVPATIDDAKIIDEARAKLEEHRKVCTGWGYSATSTAEAIAKCNCKVDPEEVKQLMWKRAKWHQAHTRVPVELAIAKDGTAIEQPAATKWADAHAAILDAKAPAKLVSK